MDIYLLGCTKDKEERKCKALDMYKKSKLFRVSLEYALSKVESKDKQIFILSAEYYLLALNDVIEPYDTSLNDFSKEEKKIWANKVHEIMKEKFDIENTNFIVLAGINYFEPLLLYLDKERIINPIPVEERTIGKRISWLKRNTGGELLLAKSFRDINVRSQVPKDKPGYYKWWASLDGLKVLLNSPFLSKNYLDDILPHLTVKKINNKDYYYIYVGIAVKESIHNRLNWHIRQKHSNSSLESGYLSTFRLSLCSLLSLNYKDEDLTNKFIDELYVEYYPFDLKIRSKKAKNVIDEMEKREIVNNVLPINIRDNKKDILKLFIKDLKNARKLSKN